jgi:hypothetical protein
MKTLKYILKCLFDLMFPPNIEEDQFKKNFKNRK